MGMRAVSASLACSFALATASTACELSEPSSSARQGSASAARYRDWQRADPKQRGLHVRGTGEMNAVIAAGRGFVAVGEADDGGSAWRSSDGLIWERALVEEPAARTSTGSMILDVTRGHGGFVGVGLAQLARGSRAAVWTSYDGRRWTRVPHQAAFGTTGFQAMNSRRLDIKRCYEVGASPA